MRVLVLLYLWMLELTGVKAGTHNFYRFMKQNSTELGTRRIFGGSKAYLRDFPSICLLTDIESNAKCSGAILSPYWVLTAAHCMDPRLRHVKYNTRTPHSGGSSVSIKKLFCHPDYKVVTEDEGRGMDVTKLYHDIGLIETKEPMKLEHSPDMSPLEALQKVPKNLLLKDVMVMGFGRTDSAVVGVGDELFSVKIRLLTCERPTWVHCVCGTSAPGERSRGVCIGDSGGPVIMNGLQVGVTSMGPNECVSMTDLDSSSTSVFTTVSNYVDLINDTINDTPGSYSMKEVALTKHGWTCFVPDKIFVSIFLVCTWFVG